MIDLNKRSKKEQKKYWSSQRVTNNMNTGEREMKTWKKPTRAMQKDAMRKEREV